MKPQARRRPKAVEAWVPIDEDTGAFEPDYIGGSKVYIVHGSRRAAKSFSYDGKAQRVRIVPVQPKRRRRT